MYLQGDEVPVDSVIAKYWRDHASGQGSQFLSGDTTNTTSRKMPVPSEPGAPTEIELVDLLNMYVPDIGVETNCWTTGAEADSPIMWETVGRDIARTSRFANERVGTVVILVNGSPLFTALARRVEPGAWRITLRGANVGYSAVEISMSNFAPYSDKFIAERLGKSAKPLKTCKEHSGFSGRQYELVLEEKQQAWLWETQSCGSGGCTSTQSVYLTEEDAKVDHCFHKLPTPAIRKATEKATSQVVGEKEFERQLYNACIHGIYRHGIDGFGAPTFEQMCFGYY